MRVTQLNPCRRGLFAQRRRRSAKRIRYGEDVVGQIVVKREELARGHKMAVQPLVVASEVGRFRNENFPYKGIFR